MNSCWHMVGNLWKGVLAESGREVFLENTAVVDKGEDGSLDKVSL